MVDRDEPAAHAHALRAGHGRPRPAGRARRSGPRGSPAGRGTTSSTRWTCGPSRSAADGGPEAAARDARYEALVAAATAHRAALVLLGHTRDDQAETVLLALARGAGPRGLAGMPARRERHGVLFARPLLDVTRADTRAACGWRADAVGGPAQHRPAYARSRVRDALPALVAALGPAVLDNLARTAATDRGRHRAARRAGRGRRVRQGASRRRRARRRRLARAARRGAHPGAALLGPPSSGRPAAPCRTGTSPPWTRWSPTGTGRGRRHCPAALRVPAGTAGCAASR